MEGGSKALRLGLRFYLISNAALMGLMQATAALHTVFKTRDVIYLRVTYAIIINGLSYKIIDQV